MTMPKVEVDADVLRLLADCAKLRARYLRKKERRAFRREDKHFFGSTALAHEDAARDADNAIGDPWVRSPRTIA